MHGVRYSDFSIDRSKRRSRAGLVWSAILALSVIAAALMGSLS